jgi:hypothetical protein
MTPEQIAQMRADMAAGTPGPWEVRKIEGVLGECVFGRANSDVALGVCEIWDFDNAPRNKPNARRTARVPDMEAMILALLAERDELRERAERAEAAINCAGALAIQRASHAFIIAALAKGINND